MDETTRERCEAYAEALGAAESPAQEWVRGELERRDLPLIQVSPLEGRLLAILVRSIGAERLLEIGTLGGYSALWLVSLLSPRARLITLERSEEHARLAREAIARAGEEDRVEIRIGDAREIIEELPGSPPFDAVFIDADKASYPRYLEAAASLLRSGGLVLGDNAFMDGRAADPPTPEGEAGGDDADDAGVSGMREFNRRLARDPAWESVVVPVRDGLAVGRLRERPAAAGSAA